MPRRNSSGTSLYHFDTLGSAAALTDLSQVITDSYTYKAFGDVATSTGTTVNPYQWVGKQGYYADPETGLLSLRRRTYDKSQSRFLSEDPLGLAAGDSNFYRYVGNNPTLWTDPSGLDRIRSQVDPKINRSSACQKPPEIAGGKTRTFYFDVERSCPTNFGLWSYTEQQSVLLGPAVRPNSICLPSGCAISKDVVSGWSGLFKDSQYGSASAICGASDGVVQANVIQFFEDLCRNKVPPPANSAVCESSAWQSAVGILKKAACAAAGAVLPGFCQTMENIPGCVKGLQNAGEDVKALIAALSGPQGLSLIQCFMEALMQALGSALSENQCSIIQSVLQKVLCVNIDVCAIMNSLKEGQGIDINAIMGLVGDVLGISAQDILAIARSCAPELDSKYLDWIVDVVQAVMSGSDLGDDLKALLGDIPELSDLPGALMGAAASEIGNLIQDLLAGFSGFLAKAAASGGVSAAVQAAWGIISSLINRCEEVSGVVSCVLQAMLGLAKEGCTPEAKASAAAKLADCLKSSLAALLGIIGGTITKLVSGLDLVERLRKLICSIKEKIYNLLKNIICKIVNKIKGLISRRNPPGGVPAGSPPPGTCAIPPAPPTKGKGLPKNPGAPRQGNKCGAIPCGNCFAAGTPVWTPDGLVPIEHLRVGQRVTTFHADERDRFESGPETFIDPTSWRVFTVRQDQGEAGMIEADLLRPANWFGEATLGETYELDLGELGLAGDVELIRIADCPPIAYGPGRLVLSAFRHSKGQVGEFTVLGVQEPIRVTALHPIWSESRGDWTPAGELRSGEEVRLWKSTGVVADFTPTTEEPVYNVEVDAEHVYRIGENGLLVHNQSAKPSTKKPSIPQPCCSGLSYSGSKSPALKPVNVGGRSVPIYGDGQETGTATCRNGVNQHRQTSINIAKMAAATGDYEYCTMNRAWSTSTGISSDTRRPDVICVRCDGTVDAWEAISATDDPFELAARLRSGMESLPVLNRGTANPPIPLYC
jgi:RHS repeat-associated protein